MKCILKHFSLTNYLLYESDSESDTNQLLQACQNLDGSEILTFESFREHLFQFWQHLALDILSC